MTLPRVRNGELARLLTPLERSLLPAVRLWGPDPERIHDEVSGLWGKRTPPVEEIRRALESARAKIQRLVDGAEEERRPGIAVRPARPDPTSTGKPVTFPGHVTRPPEKEADMAAEDDRPVTPVPEVPQDQQGVAVPGFAERIEQETHREGERVLAELARLRFDAHQVIRVMRALKLEVPRELAEIVSGSVPQDREQPQDREPQVEPTRTAGQGPEENPFDAPGKTPEPAEERQTAPEGSVEAPTAAEEQQAGVEAQEKPPEPESATGQSRRERSRKAGLAAAANRTFLDAPVPEELRTEEGAEAALREMGRDITTGRVIERFKAGTRATGERIIRYFAAKGVLVPQEITVGSAQLSWGVSGVVQDVRDKLPVPAAGWEAAPAWKTDGGMAVELVARTQAALVAILEMTGRPLIPREVLEEFEVRTGQDLPYARVSDYLRDLERADLIKRTGKTRRSKGQTAGRTAIEYAALKKAGAATSEPALPAGKDDWPPVEEVRDAIVERGEGAVSPRQVVDMVERRTGRRTNIAIVTDRMKALVQKGILTDQSVADLYLFEYRRPDGPGVAAERDRERAATHAVSNGSGPVPGTGQPLRAGNASAQALIDDCRRLGATVVKASSGHIRIRFGGRETMIASTPNSTGVKKDRARVKRVLGLAV